MCRRFFLFIFVLSLCLVSWSNAQNIVWVSETQATLEGVYFDQGWVDLLRSLGYTVDHDPGTWGDLTPEKLATLEDADLIIVSRNTNSGGYASDAAEITQWNSVQTPLILMTGYFARSNRWQWINNTTIEEYMAESAMQIIDTQHPVLTGVTVENGLVDAIDETVYEGQNTFLITNDVGNGILIAQRQDNGAVWIAEWVPGIVFYEGTTEVPADKRMLFLAGGYGGQEAGSFNLTPEGTKLYLNAVSYMLGSKPRVKAYLPNPAYGQIDVSREPVLSWRAGTLAEKNDVYYGTSFDDVNDASRDNPLDVLVSQDQVETTYDPAGILDYGQTIYWRIDGINDQDPNSPWKGDVWSFTALNFPIVIDDFEDYNDFPPNEIWNTWIDGFGDATNGSTSGYPDPDFVIGEHYVETTIVRSGGQSMPIFYDNLAGLSEVTKTLTANRDWTREGVVTLKLFVYGDAANADEKLYVALNSNAIVNISDAGVLVADWTQIDIPLEGFAMYPFLNLTNVSSLSIGLGNKTNPTPGGGSGHIFIDDIRLYRP